jgi:hypothetical protein
MLRVRYRAGVAVGPHGFPDWLPYARLLVELPPVPPGAGADAARLRDVVTANEVAARTGDPSCVRGDRAATPAGWTWAHVAMSRRIALVPVELHGAYRHLGGVSTGGGDPGRRGVRVDGGAPPRIDGGAPPRIDVAQRLAEEAVAVVEERLGYRLPAAYRDFLARTNGGRPARAALHPRFGFLADQPLFGVARTDWLQDLVYANAWFGDRLTPDWLAVGYVQGGLLAVRVRGGDEGSVWYWDDDDPRDTAGYGAAEVCARLLHRVADDFAGFWRALREVPAALRDAAAEAADSGAARLVPAQGLGAALPAARRGAAS